MNISTISSNSSSLVTQTGQQTTATAEAQKGGGENDGKNSDDGSVTANQVAPAPTVNMSGQKIGQVISTSA